uniref:zinc finger C2HC domain-containing protein 1A n=1 Tax=Ciona intestinalis TaxID=7719 RepID=UPI000180CB9E|nr:zinc finger C2HC domain-containing protein 1A [Ciona intestinalis]|eukprot:XP_002130661.1 zinc finger C2HC domain-containing protein 1A [Ciona intestinalis]
MEFEEADNRVPCSYCGRKFNPESLDRHAKICAKTSKPRPVFDSSNQRVFTAGDTNNIPVPKKNKAPITKPQKKSTVGTLKSAGDRAVRNPPQKKAPARSAQSNYNQCPHCLRKFNNEAAQRHIPFCAEQHKRIGLKKETTSIKKDSLSAQAAARAMARQNYKPPSLKPSSGRSDSRSPGNSATSRYATNGRGKNEKFNSATLRVGSNAERNGISPKRSNPEWNADIEVPAYSSEVRTRTGLKAYTSNNTEKERFQRQRGVLEEKKNTIRKISTRNDKLRQLGVDGVSDQHDLFGIGAYKSNEVSPSPSSGSKRSLKGNSPLSNHERRDFVFRKNGAYDFSETYSPEFTDSNYRLPSPGSKFCHECGSRYPISNAKFCCECGLKRIVLN